MLRSGSRLASPLARLTLALGAVLLLTRCGGAAPPAEPGEADLALRMLVGNAPVAIAPATPLPTEGFGQAVAISGQAVAVSDFLGSDHADVHTYWIDSGQAIPTGAVRPPASSETCFGETLAFQYGWLAVGSPCAFAGRGEVRLFAPDAGGWLEDGELGLQVGATARFGAAVAAGQGRFLVGAPGESGAAGAAYLFAPGASGWTLEARLAPADLVPGDEFGFAVAVAPNFLVVAAPGRVAPDPLAPRGRVYVFHLGRRGWVQEAVLAPADTACGERTSRAVAAAAGVVVVAGDYRLPHYLHAFEKTNGAWVERDLDVASRALLDAGFVHALAMDGNLLAVGMPTMTGPAGEYRPGGTWVYRRTTTGWTRLGDVPVAAHPADKFGHAVAVSKGTVVSGGPGTFEAGVTLGEGEVVIARP